jgi:hypothetical protein
MARSMASLAAGTRHQRVAFTAGAQAGVHRRVGQAHASPPTVISRDQLAEGRLAFWAPSAPPLRCMMFFACEWPAMASVSVIGRGGVGSRPPSLVSALL